MHRVLPWLVAVIPLAIAPRVSFYFDVIPRLALLLFGVAAVLALRRDPVQSVRELARDSVGRWFCVMAAVQAISLVASTFVASSSMWLSVSGSAWRRYGLITQLALLVAGVFLAADLKRSHERLGRLLRAVTICGLAASSYGILQYFDKDPLLDSAGYHVGEGIWAIVRPPGTLGHADYFGVYLLMVAFASWAVAVSDPDHKWRWLGAMAAPIALFATVLTGTRAAVLGAVAGAMVVAWRLRPRFSWRPAVAGLVMVLVASAFYVAPTGERLRARVRWSIEDAYGGARIWLWRDSLRMSAERPFLGHGPEIFHVAFPRYQSLDLARAYPDFQHESPHNLFIDTLAAQGVTGVLALAGLLVAGVFGALRANAEMRNVASVLLGCLVALVVSQQFCSPTVATALCLMATVAALVSTAGKPLPLGRLKGGLRAGLPAPQDRPMLTRALASGTGIALACVFAGYALRLSMADRYLASARNHAVAARITEAASDYDKALAWLPQGASADLPYSRLMAAAASKAPDPSSALLAWQQAMISGRRALQTSDDPANAAYNLAALCAASNDAACTESSLREAIARSPAWFKPYWLLAKVLSLSGRVREAEVAATAADDRNGRRNPEVLQTLQEIRQMGRVGSGERSTQRE